MVFTRSRQQELYLILIQHTGQCLIHFGQKIFFFNRFVILHPFTYTQLSSPKLFPPPLITRKEEKNKENSHPHHSFHSPVHGVLLHRRLLVGGSGSVSQNPLLPAAAPGSPRLPLRLPLLHLLPGWSHCHSPLTVHCNGEMLGSSMNL